MDVMARGDTPTDADALMALVSGLGFFSWMEKEDPLRNAR